MKANLWAEFLRYEKKLNQKALAPIRKIEPVRPLAKVVTMSKKQSSVKVA